MRTLTVLAVIAAVLPAAPAAAAPGWLSPPGVLAPLGEAERAADVAIDARGNAVAVWARSMPGSPARMVAAFRPAGGEFGPAVPLSGGSAGGGFPQVELDRQGNATALWREVVGGNGVVMTATRPAGGQFGPAMQLTDPAQESAFDPDLAVNAAGQAVFVWSNDTTSNIEAAARDGGSIVQLGTIDPPFANAREPAVGIDAAGNAVAAWVEIQSDPATFDLVRPAFRPAGGAFQPGALFGEGAGDAESTNVAMGANGDAVIGWDTDPVTAIYAAIRPAGGAFPASGTTISSAADLASRPQFAIDAQGQATAVWTNLSDDTVEFSMRLPHDAFDGRGTLSTDAGYFPHVDVGPGGHTVAVWKGFTASESRVAAAVRAPRGTFGAAATVAPAPSFSGEFARVSVDAAGNAIAIWPTNDGGSDGGVEFAGYDAVAPELGDVQVPAQVSTGAPVAVSASPFDVWGPVTTRWDFGDGSSASGAQATHVYDRPGTYEVRVTATDATGSASTLTRTITVTGGVARDPVARDTTAPVLSRLSISPRRFAVGRKPTPQSAQRRARRGATLRYTLSEAARVNLRVERARPGRRSRGRCSKPTRRNRAGRRCTRHVRAGALTRPGQSGTNRVAFSGRIGRRALRPGRYRFVAKASDRAGNASPAKRVSFTVVGAR